MKQYMYRLDQVMADAQKVVAGNASEEEKMEARIELDVYEALQHALSH